MSATRRNMQRTSVRQQIKDVICTLLCHPTHHRSPTQATSNLPSGTELLPNPLSKTVQPTAPVNGNPLSKDSAQERPGEPLAGQNSAEVLNSSKSLQDFASKTYEGTVTALGVAPSPSISADEELIDGLLPSDTPTLPAGAQGPVTHVPHANDDEEHIEPPRSVTEEDESSLSNGEIQGKRLYLTKVVIARNVVSGEDAPPLNLTALCLLGVGGSQERSKDIPLDRTSAQSWTLNEHITWPLVIGGLRCVVKDEEGQEVGFVDLNQRDLHMSQDSARLFVTRDLRLNLSISWKVVHERQAKGYIQENLAIVDYENEGLRLGDCFESSGHIDDINGSISAFNKAVELAQAVGSGHLPDLLTYLGLSLQYRFELTGDICDITQAIASQQEAVRFRSKDHTVSPGLLNNLACSFQSRFGHTGHMSDISEAIASQHEAVRLTPEGDADRPAWLSNLGNLFQTRFDITGDLSDISEAIAFQQEAIQLTPEGDIARPTRLNSLGGSFQSRFDCTGDMSDITEAIAAMQEAVRLTPGGHAERPTWLTNLGNSFQRRFGHTGDMSDITQAIACHQEAIQLTPEGHPYRPGLLNNLGSSFQTCFDRTGNMSDITDAIAANQEAVQLTHEGYTARPGLLTNLGNSFHRRFDRTGDMSDIAQAIVCHQEAVQLIPEGHSQRPGLLNNLGSSFQSRFEHTGNMSDITEAINAKQEAVRLMPEGHAARPVWLNNLGNSFSSRFEHTGNIADIAKAIAFQREAVQLAPEGYADRPTCLMGLGNSFKMRFDLTGSMSDITQAIDIQQEAIQLMPDGHAVYPTQLSNLGNSLKTRFKRTGNMSDIADAIAAHQEAIQLTPVGHASRPGLLANLGNSFQSRFDHMGDISDITQAIAIQQEAVQLTPKGHAHRPGLLSNVGCSFQRRFDRTGNISDITEAIVLQQEAVQLTPEGHAYLPGWLNNLGSSFSSRFDRTGDMADITEAIASQQKAVQLTPVGHADRPGWLTNLGTSFRRRFDHSGHMPDITEAIAVQQEAVQLLPEGHAALATQLSNLGISFQRRFVHAGSMDDMHSSLRCFKTAAEGSTGAPRVRLRCALSWARLVNYHNPHCLDVLVPFGFTIRSLTLVAGLEKTLQRRHRQLQEVSEFVLEAAATACSLGQPDKAVEWLEQGRCLVWGQLNELRTPMDSLRQKDSQLAQRLTDVAEKLESAGSAPTSNLSMEMSARIPLEEAARSHSALAREWEELLLAARQLPGFESFLLPIPFSNLLEGLPESGPIIIINCHQDRCDALALLCGADEPRHIPLLDFSFEKAQQYRNVLRDELYANGIRGQESMRSLDKELKQAELEARDMTQDWSDPDGIVMHNPAAVNGVLGGIWLEVAKPILNALEYSRYNTSTNSVPPRLWWCPTGVMSFLPIHAAGIYGGTNSECVMDYVVSSYTPTIAAITKRVKSSPIGMTTSGLFLTSQPKAPSALEIPGTTKEVTEVCEKAIKKGIRVLSCDGDDISMEECRKYMEEFSSVHLACHASQNASDPLESRFFLHRGELSLLSIIQMNLKNADLAFLSACQTSTGEEKLSDEAVHLAAGMLAAGYQRVVATMWSIKDSQAPKVATDFYDYLWRNRDDETGGGFDGSLSAHALHHAVQQLRLRLGNSERDLLTWIPYVHFGY